ncbi:MAG: glycosyltransferase family 2 protein [Alphaproteobacteria bacterium]|nr:glycosyltransferase family 2 protein [Alphaproteobacteria bacterium]
MAAADRPLELSVVIPTFNERENIAPLLARLEAALIGVVWQAIYVDDNSADGTAAVVKAIAARDPRILCLHRVGRRGLAGAVLEGVMASPAPFVAVIDADLQHDETILPRMLQAVRDGADLAIGSRYLTPEGASQGLSPVRQAGSRLAAGLAKFILRADVTDPVSGFFLIRRERVEAVVGQLSDQGFKILFDIIASQPAPLKIAEIPYAFAERQAGASKLDGRVVLDYLGLILSKFSRGVLPPRFLLFALVGLSGVLVHLAALYAGWSFGLRFDAAQIIAAMTAMTTNFICNNLITYRDRRLRGWRLLSGYVRFCALCGLGLIANLAIADLVHRWTPAWGVAGLAGALFGAAWNYVSTSLAVW